jgi:hypothetical protein
MEQNNTLEQLIAELDDKETVYVFERSKVLTDKDAYTNGGFSRGWWFDKGAERKEKLNEIASMIRKDRMFAANRKLAEAYEQAIEVKIEGLRYNDKRLKQSVATEIIDRNIGKPTQRVEQKSEVDGTITVELIDDESQD